MSKRRWTMKRFTTSGTWVCPAGVTQILIFGCGGGAGGWSGFKGNSSISGNAGGYGGGAAPFIPALLDVVPNTSYTVTIGTGGAGGVYSASNTVPGGDGGDTIFGSRVWKGAKNHTDASAGNLVQRLPGYLFTLAHPTSGLDPLGSQTFQFPLPGEGAAEGYEGDTYNQGYPGAGGIASTMSASLAGGNTDFGGIGGSGMSGDLRRPSTSSVGSMGGMSLYASSDGEPGYAGVANSGAGGGGGGGGGKGDKPGGNGGAGGSGLLVILYVE